VRPHLRSPRQFSRTRKRWAIINLTRPVAPKDHSWRQRRKPVIEGMNVTGYNESNSCKLVNEYSNSIDIDPSKFTSMLDNCRADLLKTSGLLKVTGPSSTKTTPRLTITIMIYRVAWGQ
jgi:hypothetical protein